MKSLCCLLALVALCLFARPAQAGFGAGFAHGNGGAFDVAPEKLADIAAAAKDAKPVPTFDLAKALAATNQPAQRSNNGCGAKSSNGCGSSGSSGCGSGGRRNGCGR